MARRADASAVDLIIISFASLKGNELKTDVVIGLISAIRPLRRGGGGGVPAGGMQHTSLSNYSCADWRVHLMQLCGPAVEGSPRDGDVCDYDACLMATDERTAHNSDSGPWCSFPQSIP